MSTESQKVTPKKRTRKPKRHKMEWEDVFLAHLRNIPVVRIAADKAGISRKTVYDWRDKDKRFSAAWEEAKEEAIDAIEALAFSSAHRGNTTLQIFMLKTQRRKLYGDKIAHSGPDDGPIQHSEGVLHIGKKPGESEYVKGLRKLRP